MWSGYILYPTVSTNRNIKNVSLLSTFPFVPLFPVSLLPVSLLPVSLLTVPFYLKLKQILQ